MFVHKMTLSSHLLGREAFVGLLQALVVSGFFFFSFLSCVSVFFATEQ